MSKKILVLSNNDYESVVEDFVPFINNAFGPVIGAEIKDLAIQYSVDAYRDTCEAIPFNKAANYAYGNFIEHIYDVTGAVSSQTNEVVFDIPEQVINRVTDLFDATCVHMRNCLRGNNLEGHADAISRVKDKLLVRVVETESDAEDSIEALADRWKQYISDHAEVVREFCGDTESQCSN